VFVPETKGEGERVSIFVSETKTTEGVCVGVMDGEEGVEVGKTPKGLEVTTFFPVCFTRFHFWRVCCERGLLLLLLLLLLSLVLLLFLLVLLLLFLFLLVLELSVIVLVEFFGSVL